MQCDAVWCSAMQCGAVCCSVLQCDEVWCSVMQCVAQRCSVVQCGAVWCSALECHTATHRNSPVTCRNSLQHTAPQCPRTSLTPRSDHVKQLLIWLYRFFTGRGGLPVDKRLDFFNYLLCCVLTFQVLGSGVLGSTGSGFQVLGSGVWGLKGLGFRV